MVHGPHSDKWMYAVLCRGLYFPFLLLLPLSACRSDSEKARLMLNQAAVLERQHKTDEAERLLNSIVSKYGYTKEATEANQILAMLEIARLRAKTNELRRNTLLQTLIRFLVDCGRYPTNEEGLKSLVVNPGLQCWAGPYLNSGEAFWIEEFDYNLQGDEPQITLKGH